VFYRRTGFLLSAIGAPPKTRSERELDLFRRMVAVIDDNGGRASGNAIRDALQMGRTEQQRAVRAFIAARWLQRPSDNAPLTVTEEGRQALSPGF